MTIDPFAPDVDVEFPEFSEPEPPDDFFPSAPSAPAAPAAPAAAAAAASASIPAPAAAAGADLSILAAQLSVDLSVADLATLQSIGTMLGLCKNDAMWVLFLLQMKAGAAFKTVPHEVEKVILRSKEAAELQTKMATVEASSAAAKSVKKDIFKALAEGQNKSLKPLFSAVAGAAFVGLALGGVIGFWLGNLSNIQHPWVLNLAKFFGIGIGA